jgi:hypothetical protein
LKLIWRIILAPYSTLCNCFHAFICKSEKGKSAFVSLWVRRVRSGGRVLAARQQITMGGVFEVDWRVIQASYSMLCNYSHACICQSNRDAAVCVPDESATTAACWLHDNKSLWVESLKLIGA